LSPRRACSRPQRVQKGAVLSGTWRWRSLSLQLGSKSRSKGKVEEGSSVIDIEGNRWRVPPPGVEIGVKEGGGGVVLPGVKVTVNEGGGVIVKIGVSRG